MTEPVVDTTLMGWKAWTVIGIIAFVCLITLLGIYNPTARAYIDGASKVILNVIPAFGGGK